MTTYAPGTTATLTVQWYQYAGGPAADVTAQTITIKKVADATVVLGPTAAGITHLATGLYSYQWAISAGQDSADYVAIWDATDAQSEAVQTSEVVTVSGGTGWAPDYLTAAQYKDWARIGDTADDTEIATAITTASRAIDRSCSRQFGRVAAAEARTYVARFDRHRPRPAWVVDIDDLATTSGFIVSVASTVVTDYSLEPRNAVAKGKVWTLLVFGASAEATPPGSAEYEVDMTGLWGWPSVPSTVAHAAKIQTQRFVSRRDSPYGVAGSPADGSELRLLAKLDPDVELMLSDYRRRWAAVSSPVPYAPTLAAYPWGAP